MTSRHFDLAVIPSPFCNRGKGSAKRGGARRSSDRVALCMTSWASKESYVLFKDASVPLGFSGSLALSVIHGR